MSSGFKTFRSLTRKIARKANSAEFVAPLKEATFVFIDGGRQWRLADAYLAHAWNVNCETC